MSYILVEDKQAKMLQLLSKKSFLKKILLYIHTCAKMDMDRKRILGVGCERCVCVCLCCVQSIYNLRF